MRSAPRAYLDHAATSPVRPEVRVAVVASLDLAGNPSSIHTEGRQARALVERARATVGRALGAERNGAIVFTSGATEANASVLRGAGVTLASAVEHPSVLAQPAIETLPVDRHGRLDLSALEARLARGDVGRLAVMLANNETGVIQPVTEAARLARAAGVQLHVDAVQALGKQPIDVEALDCDSIAVSAHKIGGPKGVGALWLRDADILSPLLLGGGQEGRYRAGTENLAGIAGFAAGLEARRVDEPTRLAELRDTLETTVRGIATDAVVIAADSRRLAHISAIALPGVPAATQVIALDLAGVAVSAGAACSSGKVAPSHVLQAMRITPALAACTIRVSLGWNSTAADIARFLEVWATLAARRSRSAA